MDNWPTDEPEEGALFDIKGAAAVSCAWVIAGKGDDAATVNLGPRGAVATKLELTG